MEFEEQTAETYVLEIEKCRARNVGVSGFAECEYNGPNPCAYALPFGYAFLCQHPRLAEIIKQTQTEPTGARTNI